MLQPDLGRQCPPELRRVVLRCDLLTNSHPYRSSIRLAVAAPNRAAFGGTDGDAFVTTFVIPHGPVRR